MMNIIPIVFAFDNNLAMPAAVCFYSLFVNANPETKYDVYVLHRKNEELDLIYINKVFEKYPKHSLKMIDVGDTFDKSFEIRGITTPAYYRLLIPDLIPEYDKVIYSDVDVIFQQDLGDLYMSTDLGEDLIAGVNNVAHLDKDLRCHYEGVLSLDPQNIICSGFLLMNSQKIREENLVSSFITHSKNKYKFQDQDVLNIVCRGRIRMLSPQFSLLTYISYMAVNNRDSLLDMWSEVEIAEAIKAGNIHYNGQKPWKGYCINFDIWWEYYRKSPLFDEKWYFDFFYKKLDELEQLSLMKRIKILVRYFVYGRKKS